MTFTRFHATVSKSSIIIVSHCYLSNAIISHLRKMATQLQLEKLGLQMQVQDKSYL